MVRVERGDNGAKSAGCGSEYDGNCQCLLSSKPHLVRVIFLWRSAVVVGISLGIGACTYQSS